MRIDHQRDVLGTNSDVEEAVLEPGRPALAAILYAVDVVELLIFLVPRAGVDENRTDLMLDEETAHPELDAIALIGNDTALPEHLRHDAEHRAAVQLLTAGLDRVDRPPADAARFD